MEHWDAERAERWSRMQAHRSETLGPATEMMLDLADLRTGSRVLDVAAGTGDQTVLAAERVGPSGYVLATDISTNMLNAAAEAVRRVGLTNVETRIMDAENLDLDADSFDAVICRCGLHTVPDPLQAVRGMRRVVKAGGKVAALVYSTAKTNPYLGVPATGAHRWGSIMNSMFALSEPGVLENAFRDGGFPSVVLHNVSTQRCFPPSTEIIQRIEGSESGRYINKLGDADREQAWAEIERQLRGFKGPNGWEFPGELLIAVGTK